MCISQEFTIPILSITKKPSGTHRKAFFMPVCANLAKRLVLETNESEFESPDGYFWNVIMIK